jgi:hypothetical protein
LSSMAPNQNVGRLFLLPPTDDGNSRKRGEQLSVEGHTN